MRAWWCEPCEVYETAPAAPECWSCDRLMVAAPMFHPAQTASLLDRRLAGFVPYYTED